MGKFLHWLDDRTGIRGLLHEALYERVPGGARWRYVWGSTLVVAFVTQLITGIFLWMAYSPSSQTAWESVYYIEHEMSGGWLLRGIHHYMAQAMIVLLGLHLLQVVIDGAYRAPREVNFWLGLVLMLLVLGLSLTGYLLPWDQKGYWATQVATSLMGQVPWIGPSLQTLVAGGPEYGHHTLTRFFALHAGVLPGLLIFFLVLHVALFRRHGLHATRPDRRPDATFWPDQVLRDSVASLAVLAFVVFFAWYQRAELGAPADAAAPYSAARPEWYFLFLFQLLKYFPGTSEAIAAIIFPGTVMLILFLMPIVGRWKLGHRFNVGFLLALLVGAGLLTFEAMRDDRYARWHEYRAVTHADDPDVRAAYEAKFAASHNFLDAQKEAQIEADRVIELARKSGGIPRGGAVALMEADIQIKGRRLFRQHCAVCHAYENMADAGDLQNIRVEKPSAPNLFGFASRAWIRGLLDPKTIKDQHYFGYESIGEDGKPKPSPFADGEMSQFIAGLFEDPDDEGRKEMNADLDAVAAALSAEAALKPQMAIDKMDAKKIELGRTLIAEEIGCADCHKFHDVGDLGMAPDLTGYGSRDWLAAFIANPASDRFYAARNDRMPAFEKRLSEKEIETISAWLRGDWKQIDARID